MGYTPPNEIDIGNAAIDRITAWGANYTYIDKNTPANGSGVISSVEIYVDTAMTGCKVGTFYVTGTNILSCRDYEVVGDLATGYHKIDVNINVLEGDYIAILYTGGAIDADTSGALGRWYKSGDYMPCEDETFSTGANRMFSVCGTGSTGSGILTIGEAFTTVDSLAKSAIKQLGEAFSIVDSKITKIVKALGETVSIVDSFVHTLRLLFYETFAVKDSFTTYLLSLWHKVTKEIAKFTKVEKEKDDWTKIEKEKEDCNRVDKTDVGWLVNGWLIFGWLLSSLWGIVSKLSNGWEKVNKE